MNCPTCDEHKSRFSRLDRAADNCKDPARRAKLTAAALSELTRYNAHFDQCHRWGKRALYQQQTLFA